MPVFATTAIDSVAIDNLPENAVPDLLIQAATHMPEASDIKTTMHGPASRMNIFSRQEAAADNTSDDESNSAGEDMQNEAITVPEALNEHEAIIAVDDESLPNRGRLFEKLNTNLEMFQREARKLAEAHMKEHSNDNEAEAAARNTAGKELISTTIAVNLQDIAGQLRKK